MQINRRNWCKWTIMDGRTDSWTHANTHHWSSSPEQTPHLIITRVSTSQSRHTVKPLNSFCDSILHCEKWLIFLRIALTWKTDEQKASSSKCKWHQRGSQRPHMHLYTVCEPVNPIQATDKRATDAIAQAKADSRSAQLAARHHRHAKSNHCTDKRLTVWMIDSLSALLICRKYYCYRRLFQRNRLCSFKRCNYGSRIRLPGKSGLFNVKWIHVRKSVGDSLWTARQIFT